MRLHGSRGPNTPCACHPCSAARVGVGVGARGAWPQTPVHLGGGGGGGGGGARMGGPTHRGFVSAVCDTSFLPANAPPTVRRPKWTRRRRRHPRCRRRRRSRHGPGQPPPAAPPCPRRSGPHSDTRQRWRHPGWPLPRSWRYPAQPHTPAHLRHRHRHRLPPHPPPPGARNADTASAAV